MKTDDEGTSSTPGLAQKKKPSHTAPVTGRGSVTSGSHLSWSFKSFPSSPAPSSTPSSSLESSSISAFVKHTISGVGFAERDYFAELYSATGFANGFAESRTGSAHPGSAPRRSRRQERCDRCSSRLYVLLFGKVESENYTMLRAFYLIARSMLLAYSLFALGSCTMVS